MTHPYESIEVEYLPPQRPERIAKVVYVPTTGICTESRLLVDGVDTSCREAKEIGWGKISRWITQTKEWEEREQCPDKSRYDMIRVAKMRRAKAFGEPQGPVSEVCAGFENYLMDNGWIPVMLDRLNAYCPGRCLSGDVEGNGAVRNAVVYHTHVYVKGEKIVSMQFGFGPFKFVFMCSWLPGTYQVPVSEQGYRDALDGKLQDMTWQGCEKVYTVPSAKAER